MRTALTVGLSLLVVASAAFALDVPPVEGRVVDRASLLTAAEAAALEQKLADFEKATGHQFALLTVPSLEDDAIEDFSMRVVEAWKLGAKDRDDGLLLLIAFEDKKMRIEVGYGLEGAIPDILAGKIIRHTLAPAFREGKYAEGIDTAFDQLMAASEGEAVAVGEPEEDPLLDWFLVLLALGALVYIFFFAKEREPSPIVTSGLPPRPIRSSSSPSRRSSGGGFRGGGGGFGGGGASGGW